MLSAFNIEHMSLKGSIGKILITSLKAFVNIGSNWCCSMYALISIGRAAPSKNKELSEILFKLININNSFSF